MFEAVGAESSEFKDMMVELMTLAGLPNVGDYVPAVAWMDLQGIERRMKELHRRVDVVLSRVMREHEATAVERKGRPDLLDQVVASRDSLEGEKLSDIHFKALLLVRTLAMHGPY